MSMEESSSYGGELAVGQVWNIQRDGGRRTLLAAERRLRGGVAQYRMTESGTDFGRWIDAAWIVTHGERCQ